MNRWRVLVQLKAGGPPSEEDSSIGAQLMRLRNPRTGAPLADEFLLPQISVLFWAGFDTTGNTMAWTLYCISQHAEVPALKSKNPPPPPFLHHPHPCPPVILLPACQLYDQALCHTVGVTLGCPFGVALEVVGHTHGVTLGAMIHTLGVTILG